jgi:hypothetical protein
MAITSSTYLIKEVDESGEGNARIYESGGKMRCSRNYKCRYNDNVQRRGLATSGINAKRPAVPDVRRKGAEKECW